VSVCGGFLSRLLRNLSTTHSIGPVANMIPSMILAVAALCSLSVAKETAVDMKLKVELFDSGVRHEQIMSIKKVSHGA